MDEKKSCTGFHPSAWSSIDSEIFVLTTTVSVPKSIGAYSRHSDIFLKQDTRRTRILSRVSNLMHEAHLQFGIKE